ncbi:MAG TPA: chemotaxis protein CheB, partial [Vicinamibacteria bacterium]|nr:chemotaxis protein CheB [Vicinamibacteria bacterium]
MARRRARSGAKAAVAEASATTSGPAAVPVVVVGLGASAGGLEAVQRLLARVPDDSGLSFVLVLMLRRDARQLARLVARQTRMRVELV